MLREFIAGKKKDGLRVLVDNYPWDDWLVRGLKPVENRHLSVVIHPSSGGRWWPVKQNKGRASTEALGEHQEAIRGDLEDALALVPPGKERTGIIGMVRVIVCWDTRDPKLLPDWKQHFHDDHLPWMEGPSSTRPFAWVVDQAIEFDVPIPCHGGNFGPMSIDKYSLATAEDEEDSTVRAALIARLQSLGRLRK